MTDYNPQELVNHFVQSVGKHFHMIEQAYTLHRALKATVFGMKGFKEVHPDQIGNHFSILRLTLSGSNFSVEISYGDREHDMNCSIHHKLFKEAYALWEWLKVMGDGELIKDHGGWVLTPNRIETVILQYESILDHLLPLVIVADRSLEDKLERFRQERMQQDQQHYAEEEHQRLALQATDAFHQKKYKEVVEILSSVRVALTPSEKAKLAYAWKKTT